MRPPGRPRARAFGGGVNQQRPRPAARHADQGAARARLRGAQRDGKKGRRRERLFLESRGRARAGPIGGGARRSAEGSRAGRKASLREGGAAFSRPAPAGTAPPSSPPQGRAAAAPRIAAHRVPTRPRYVPRGEQHRTSQRGANGRLRPRVPSGAQSSRPGRAVPDAARTDLAERRSGCPSALCGLRAALPGSLPVLPLPGPPDRDGGGAAANRLQLPPAEPGARGDLTHVTAPRRRVTHAGFVPAFLLQPTRSEEEGRGAEHASSSRARRLGERGRGPGGAGRRFPQAGKGNGTGRKRTLSPAAPQKQPQAGTNKPRRKKERILKQEQTVCSWTLSKGTASASVRFPGESNLPSAVPVSFSAGGSEKANVRCYPKAGLCEPTEPSDAALSWMYERDSAEDTSIRKSLDGFYKMYCKKWPDRMDPTYEAASRCLSQKISELANRDGKKYALRCLQMAQVVLNRDGCKIFPNHPTTACFSKPAEEVALEDRKRTPGLSDDVLQFLLKQTQTEGSPDVSHEK
ncbi:shieldin complex subunit 1 [Falco naumanni]|uniref:shieldin complex subunit 1 n=1 Tax=Falco naumanni TaxID=148594 RepID=UPI001ADE3E25|nr:shieldin complex subunit 1 [Falco naumanni]